MTLTHPSADPETGRPVTQPTTDTLGALGDALTGTIFTSDDPSWDGVRMPWNVVVDQRPIAVVVAADADDVVTTVRFAAEHGLAVAAQPGGHGASRASDGAILLRTGALQDVWIDADARVARVGAGVKWGTLQAALDDTGLTGLVGSNPDVTVVGYTLGGGLSWLSRSFGRGSGAARAFEVVDARGQHRWVTDASEPELMWAMRGGGGDFGIVTAVEIDLFPVPQLAAATLVFPAQVAGSVLRAFTQVTSTASPELTCWANIMHMPDMPLVPEPMRGQSFVIVTVAFLGSPEDLDGHVEPFRAAGPPLRDDVRAISPGELGLIAEEPVEPTPAVLASAYLHTFDDAAIDRLVEMVGVGSGTALAMVQVRHLGGAITTSRVPAVATGTPESYCVTPMGFVMDPGMAGLVNDQLDAVMAAMAPWSSGRTNLTFLDRDESMTRCYDEPALDRLRAVKRTVDPDGVIRSNRPVPGV